MAWPTTASILLLTAHCRGAALCRAKHGSASPADLAEWTGPIFILAGEASDNPAALYHMRPAIPYDVVKGTGHWLQLDAPDIVVQAILRIIAGIENK